VKVHNCSIVPMHTCSQSQYCGDKAVDVPSRTAQSYKPAMSIKRPSLNLVKWGMRCLPLGSHS
jgi:hypothetical protein